MNMHRHFGISTTSLRDSTIRTLMDDLGRTMRLVECDITAEEERAGIFDRADVAYPAMAIALATRRLAFMLARFCGKANCASKEKTWSAPNRQGCAGGCAHATRPA